MSAEWQFLVTLNERLRPLKDPRQIKDVAVRLLGEHLRASRAHYTRIAGDQFEIISAYTDGVRPLPERGRLDAFTKAFFEPLRRGEMLVCRDAAGDPRFSAADRQSLAARQVAACVGAPLIKDGSWIGFLSVHSAVPRAWTDDQVDLIEITAQRMWSVAERARVEDALSRSRSRQDFLRTLNDTIRPVADPLIILAETCRLLGQHLRVGRVCYVDIEGDDCTKVAEYLDGVPALPNHFPWRPLAGSRANDILQGGTLITNDTGEMQEHEALHAAGIGSYLCPLLVKEGRFIGAFGIHDRTARVWTTDEITLAEEVADRVWSALEHRKADADRRANEDRLDFLLRLNDALRSLTHPGDVQETAARLLAEHLRATRAGYAEIGASHVTIRHEHARGVEPLVGQVRGSWITRELFAQLERGETVVIADAATDDRLVESNREILRGRDIAAFIAVGLFRQQQMVAVFGVNHREPRAWNAAEIELVRDVAERTWSATERARAEEALRRQQQRLQLALDASTGALWWWEAATNEVYWDPRFRELYGLPPDQPPSTDAWVPRVHEDDRARVLADVNDLMTSPSRHSWENTFRVVRADGSIGWIQSRGQAERDASGKVVRLTGLDLNFDHHRRAEEALQESRDLEHHRALQARTDELEYRTSLLSQMASDLTLAEQRAREQIAKDLHDGLQQMLVIASVNLERQLQREKERGFDSSDLLSEAQKNLEQAITAARSLNFELFPPVLARAGLPAALNWLAGWTRDKYRIQVEFQADPLADSARKDVRTLLFESVRELILNAVKHARADRITLQLALSGENLCITVADEGAGFDVARLNDRSKRDQSGWGLFSIRERLTLLGGEFSIRSTPGSGTRVCLIARRTVTADPALVQSVFGLAPIESPRQDHRGTAGNGALRILIVDDSAAMKDALRSMLEERPQLSVIGTASNGFEAIAHAHALHPDVILMDVAMPHMDGIEATARIHAELPDIEVLGLSTYERGVSGEAMQLAGAAAFFVKGVDIDQMIDHLLQLHSARTRDEPARS